jgi:hypothetical protein
LRWPLALELPAIVLILPALKLKQVRSDTSLTLPAKNMAQPIVKFAVALFVCPCRLHVAVAVPPLPVDSMCHDQLTMPLLPTIFAEPSKETGLRPVEYTTSAEHDAPGVLLAYSVAYEP